MKNTLKPITLSVQDIVELENVGFDLTCQMESIKATLILCQQSLHPTEPIIDVLGGLCYTLEKMKDDANKINTALEKE